MVNEELVPNYDTSAWVKTEKYLSEDWYQEIRNNEERSAVFFDWQWESNQNTIFSKVFRASI